MAVNESRSLNTDLIEGLTDGLVIKSTPGRGGVAEHPDNSFWNNEQYGKTTGDAHVSEIASRVFGLNGVKRSGKRAY